MVTLVNQHMRGLRIIWAHRAAAVQPTRDLTDAAVLDATQATPLPGLVVARRLGFLPRLVSHAPPSLLACLQNWPEWQAQLVADLALLRAASAHLTGLPHPTEAVAPWLQFARDYPAQWKGYIRKALPAMAKVAWAGHVSRARDHGGRGDLDPSQADEYTPHCPECN
eukprot:8840177-Alexandrium_andersonii.AAC.1